MHLWIQKDLSHPTNNATCNNYKHCIILLASSILFGHPVGKMTQLLPKASVISRFQVSAKARECITTLGNLHLLAKWTYHHKNPSTPQCQPSPWNKDLRMPNWVTIVLDNPLNKALLPWEGGIGGAPLDSHNITKPRRSWPFLQSVHPM